MSLEATVNWAIGRLFQMHDDEEDGALPRGEDCREIARMLEAALDLHRMGTQ